MTDNLPEKPATSDFRPSKGLVGRRTKYNDKIAEQIYLCVAEGMSLREISRLPGAPSWSVLKVWMLQHPEFRQTIEAIRWLNSTEYIAEGLECFKGFDADSLSFEDRLALAKAESAALFTAARLMELRKPPRQIVENEDDT